MKSTNNKVASNYTIRNPIYENNCPRGQSPIESDESDSD